MNISFFTVFKALFILTFSLGAVLPGFAIRPSWAGRPDNTFGNAGKVTNLFNESDLITDMALQPDGKIVTANSAFINNQYDIGVSRYNRDGSVDLSFGNQGNTVTNLTNTNDRATGIALQPDGKVLVSGFTVSGFFSPVIVRYNSNGLLDASFGSGGIIVFSNIVGQFDDVKVQPDGKIVLGGFRLNINNNQTDFLLIRLLPDGQLDQSFGTGGVVITGFTAPPATTPTPTPTPTPGQRINAALAANGGVASASSQSPGDAYSPALANDGVRAWGATGGWRDGTPDVFPDWLQIDFNSPKTIGEISVYTVRDNFTSTAEPTDAETFTLYGITDFEVQYWDGSNWVTVPNGNITNNNKVVVKVSFPPVTTSRIRILVRNGLNSYSRIVEVEAWTANLPPPPPPPPTPVETNETIRDLALQSDGKIIAVGTTDFINLRGDFALARYNPDGSLDASFDGDGRVTTDFGGGHDEARAVGLQSDGKIVAGGYATVSGGESALARYNPDGSLDTTLDGDGKVTLGGLPFGFFDIVVHPSNKIIGGSTIGNNFALARFNANGTLDTTFDFDGIIQTEFPGQSVINAILLQPDGKLLAGGSTYNPNSRTTLNALARYHLSIAHADFDGDNRTDLSVFRPSSFTWYLQQSRLGFAFAQLGSPTDIPVAADYDGDGKYDIANYNAGVWTVLQSQSGTTRRVRFGLAGDIPVPGDYNGDYRDDFAVFRNGSWFILNSADSTFTSIQFGQAGDMPVPADYDHDGRLDPAVYRGGVWYLLKSTEGFAAVRFGNASDIPVVGDFDGDGRADQTVYREGIWYSNRSRDGFAAVQFGLQFDIPLTGDFDGDDVTDFAVFRNGFWYVLGSTRGFTSEKFGQDGDRPIPIAKLQSN